MPENLPLSITARTDTTVTRYERGGGRSCISISGDHERPVVGASGLELGPSGQGRPRGKNLGEIEVSEWRKVARGWKGLRDGEWLQEGWMWRRMFSRKLDVTEAPSWTLGVMDFLVETLGS